MRLACLPLFIVLSFFALIGFDSPVIQTNASRLPTREELFRNMFEIRRLVVIHSGADARTAQLYRDYLNSGRMRRFPMTIAADAEFPTDSLAHLPLRVLGALNTNRAIQNLLPGLPLEQIPGGFRFSGKEYRDSSAVVSLFYPNPRNPRMQLRLTTGNSDAAILHYLGNRQEFGMDTGDYCVISQGRIDLIGFFQDTGVHAWQTAHAREYRLDSEQKPTLESQHFIFIAHGENFNAAALQQLAEQHEAKLHKLLERLHISPAQADNLLKLTVHLWNTLEEKALFTRRSELCHSDWSRWEVHLVWNDKLRGDDFMAEAECFIQKLLPQTASAALREGLAVALSQNWRGLGFQAWAARLQATNNYIPLAELFEPEIWQAESPLARQIQLGSFVDFLLKHFSEEEFKQLYRTWPQNGVPQIFPRGATWASLNKNWEEATRRTPAIPLRHTQPRAITSQSFHRGFCYAHEGYQVFNGYMGHRSRESLQKLAAMNVNAVSITPFGYLRDPNQPDFLRRSEGVNSENDESLLASMHWAQELGMHAMLKPHILMAGPRWGWPGDVVMNSPEDWKKFFEHYERWMRHYALLAEMYGFDSLCLGVELVQTTRNHEAEWREVIGKMRGLYSGPIVYASNWGEEFERLSFWNELDAIAFNCYYPLSERESASDAELLEGAKTIVAKIESIAQKYRKPVLITEIGFASRAQTWQQPHSDDRRAPAYMADQARCYEAMLKALWGKPWFAGIYWWKWPTDLSDGGPNDNQFTPNNKPGAEVIANWFRQEGKRAEAGQ